MTAYIWLVAIMAPIITAGVITAFNLGILAERRAHHDQEWDDLETRLERMHRDDNI